MFEEQESSQEQKQPAADFPQSQNLLLLFPPPNELIPTEIRLSPIDMTTVPVTTDGKNLRSGFKKKPRTVSNRPPMIDAPMIAPYASTPPPIVAATLLNTPINPEEVPMMIGTFPPIGPIPKQLYQCHNTRNQHCILKQAEL